VLGDSSDMLKYVILWSLFNVHTSVQTPTYVLLNDHKEVIRFENATECAKDLIREPAQKPDAKGNIVLFECAREGDRPTAQFTGLVKVEQSVG
jgi:hypothetical protein